MIMATMTELAQRMLTNRPTVARISESGIWPASISPTRACEPRTEITRPKHVTVEAWSFRKIKCPANMPGRGWKIR
ncbi:hypothetical protein MTX26_21000 [Bradyrhizobium sp. ISRA443]|uniref:hypothetical protein n=1 Tax=unclassified Bradyrhizobium TaxID=2631580 RepID=UPI00247ABD3E|nr:MULTISPECIES: hypothetical protein [unclassified Bradyrhizobium]WGR96300.1 hypothetical protein MTX20_31705 [Bradyrhizobium sp. ISRA435]WGS02944.1 hypothetical protein MTX23_21000 [Bradyrhizobium sp. ISRA436]WGS09830.1 hypothetical protein MTX18_21000 [Bradyrhizobium sp. ISRA437]WGS16716.1 hypothetical protein MTX26_21000 [Bradyrhizobium sp. ISRA443]